MPSIGSIHEYTLTEQDAKQITRRRHDAGHFIAEGTVGNTGFILHVGNPVAEGDKFPLIVTRVWPDGKVNGQVMLDGNDSLWVTSVSL